MRSARGGLHTNFTSIMSYSFTTKWGQQLNFTILKYELPLLIRYDPFETREAFLFDMPDVQQSVLVGSIGRCQRLHPPLTPPPTPPSYPNMVTSGSENSRWRHPISQIPRFLNGHSQTNGWRYGGFPLALSPTIINWSFIYVLYEIIK